MHPPLDFGPVAPELVLVGVGLLLLALRRRVPFSLKLRLLYEASPMAFICEAAGGAGSTGTGRILDVEPTRLHERVPVFLGSREEVALAEKFMREG